MADRYRKKPVEVEAVVWTGDNIGEICKFAFGCAYPLIDGRLVIGTIEGAVEASFGDYIIKGVNGEFYPCKPDIFEKTYEKVK